MSLRISAPFQSVPHMYQAPPIQMSNVPCCPVNFPPFHINESDFNVGVVMKAKSPSGAHRNLELLKDNSGQYTTNFVPNEIGDWQISIMCSSRHIKGSPFNVRVYDHTKVRVFGLEGGDCGKPVCFTIDASAAGAGKLKVEVFKDAAPVECRLMPRSNCVYECIFNPRGPGFYKIRIFFATQEIQGSPFGVKIVDTQKVSVIGDGVVSCLVKRKTSFTVNTAKAGLCGDVAVNIFGPCGNPVPPKATKCGDHSYLIEYTPIETGNYKVDVHYEGRQICKGPFTCKVFGLNLCKVTKKPKEVLICRPCFIEFECPESGSGEPEVLVNAGRVPVELTTLTDRRYRASFIPPRVGEYCVQVSLYGEEIEGGFFKVKCFDASRMTTTLDTLRPIVQQQVCFQVCTKPFDGELDVCLSSPTGKPVSCKIDKTNEFSYIVEFLPHEIGTYNLVVKFDDLHIYGSPFKVHVGNPKGVLLAIKCKSVALGHPFHFTADTSRAGPGELTVRANNSEGPIAVQAKQVRTGTYDIDFVSNVAGPCFAEVLFDGQHHADSPFELNVYDVRHVTVSAGHNLVRCGQFRTIHVTTDGCADLTAKIACGSQRNMPLAVKGSVACGFEATFQPTEPGPYQVDFFYGSVLVPTCPIKYMCYDPCKVRVVGVGDGIAFQKSTFIIDLNDCGEGELEVIIISSYSGKPILNEVTPLQAGKLQVCYTPSEGGPHYAEVSFNKEAVTGSPFQFKVFDLKRMTVKGEGVDAVMANDTAIFHILSNEARADDFEVIIKGPSGCRQIMPLLSDVCNNQMLNNQVKVEYFPKIAGDYQISVNYHNIPIPNSPFCVKVWDPCKVLISKVCQGQVGIESTFHVTLKDAGDGTVEISIVDSCGQLIANNVTSTTPGCLKVCYVPQQAGEHHAVVEFNGVKIPGCPMKFNVIDPTRVCARGDGLGLVECRVPTAFYVTAPECKVKDFLIRVVGPNQSELNNTITENSAGLKVEYTPTLVGPHQVCITYCGQALVGSPFSARSWDASRVMLTAICMGQVGCRSNFKVLVGEAGEGVCEMSVTDAQGQLVPNQAVPDMEGSIDVSFIPTCFGLHRGTVLFNKQKVPGSPFKFMVIDKSRINCHGEGIGFVQVKRACCFTINAPLADFKDIEAKIIGPKDVEVPLRLTEGSNCNFKVEYTPHCSGDYQIAVKYFGQPVYIGVAKAWDLGRISVGSITTGKVGREVTFNVDARDAGEGNLEIMVSDPQGKLIENSVCLLNKTSGLFQVSCVPKVHGIHKICVQFNDEDAHGSPYTMCVCDPRQTCLVGDGLGNVKCSKPTSFFITAPSACLGDLRVLITDPCGRNVKHSLVDNGCEKFQVEYIPSSPGTYTITVHYFEELVVGCPYFSTAWNSSCVTVSGIKAGIHGRPNTFIVHSGQAGPGNLELKVSTVTGNLVRNTARALDNGDVEVTFVPNCKEDHHIFVIFNGETIPGCPYICPVINGSLAIAHGPALGRCRARHPTKFNINCKPVGCHGEIEHCITAPCGSAVPTTITGSYAQGYVVEFVPLEAGIYLIEVKCAETALKDSPFKCEVFDANEVVITRPCITAVSRCTTFNADTSRAGPGKFTVTVQGRKSRPTVEIIKEMNDYHLINFTPTESGHHNVVIKYNDFDVPGSPFLLNAIDQKLLKVKVDSLSLVNQPVTVHLDTCTEQEFNSECIVKDPCGCVIPVVRGRHSLVSTFTFIPDKIGCHEICIRYADEELSGGPFICNVFNPAVMVNLS